MLLRDWSKEIISGETVQSYKVDDLLDHIRKRVWEYFRRKVQGNFFLRLFGLEGKVRSIFEEIFGLEI